MTDVPATSPPSGFPGWPSYERDEIEAAVRVLKSGRVNYWTGEEGRNFEREFAAYVGCKHAVALTNGSVALELALHVLGIGAGDEVVVTPRSFIASASCAVLRGARPVFVDIERESGTISAATIEPALGPKTKAIIAVHLGGWPCDLDPILALARRHNLVVVEDCAQAHGATYKGRHVGSLGDAGAFSFCQDKILTTGGEGGMLTLNDDSAWARAWSYKDHGKSYDAVYQRSHPPGYRWLYEDFGTNWRMLEVQAAIGRVMLPKLASWVDRRRRNAAILAECFSSLSALRVPVPAAGLAPSYYRFYVYVRPEMLKPGWSRDHIMTTVSAQGVPCTVGSCSEMYLEKAFARHGLQPARRLPVAQELGETALCFPVHHTLGEADVRRMGQIAARIVTEATA
jgi:dTDP-4-amino-4,6-dideoxygalactose transaminase